MWIGRKSLKNCVRDSAAMEIIEIAVMTSHNLYFSFLSMMNYLKLHWRVSRVFFNKLVKTLFAVVPTKKYRFYHFFPLFYGELMQPTKKYGQIHHQRFKINTKRCFLFLFTQMFMLTVIFPFSIVRPYWIEWINGKRSNSIFLAPLSSHLFVMKL